MKKIILLFWLASSCAFAAPQHAQLIAQAKTTAAYDLKDPESAKFRNIVVVRDSVCGEINAKNSMGGYVGYKRFFAVGGVVARIDNDESPFQEAWSKICVKNPPKPKPPPEYYEESWKEMK
jgi:hypothetical protein